MALEFRKEALKKLSSPDDLDRLMPVTDRRGWIALAACAVIISAVVAWGYFGWVSTTVNGEGMIMSEGTISSITVRTGGILTGFTIKSGDPVQKGQILAVVEQPELRQKFIEDFSAYEFVSEHESEQRQFLVKQIGKQEEKLHKLQVLYQDGLIEKGLLTAAERDIMELKSKLYALAQSVSTVGRNLERSRENYKWRSAVAAPFSGKVTEVHFQDGEQVGEGAELLLAEPYEAVQEHDLRLDLYVSSGDAKKIRNGMDVYVALATIKPEQDGYVIGKVSNVSQYPKTLKAIAAAVKNDQLAQKFSQSSPPYKITVNLLRDSNSFSGYRWTSGKGPRTKITSGMLCTGKIVVEEQRPLELVIPMLKKYVLGNAQ